MTQALQSLALIRGLLVPQTEEQHLPPHLQPVIQSLVDRILARSTDQPLAAAAVEESQQQRSSTAAASHSRLEEEQRRLGEAAVVQRRTVDEARARLQGGYEGANEQQAAVKASVLCLAELLATLQTPGPGSPLLSVEVPQQLADGKAKLLQSLAASLDRLPAGAAEPAPAHEAQQQAEFARLQEALRLAAAAKVETQAGVARAQAELDFLQPCSTNPGPANGASASIEVLEQEVQQLKAKLSAELERTCAVAGEASMLHVATAVAQQHLAKIQRARARCAAKRQALDVLAKHVALQQLLAEVLRQERQRLGQVQGLVQAALGDGQAVLLATQQRVQLVNQSSHAQRQQERREQQPDEAGRAQQEGTTGRSTGEAEPAAGAADDIQESSGLQKARHEAVAGQLLQLRASLRQLSAELQQELLPAYQAAFAQLHGLVFQGIDVRAPVLTAPGVQGKLATAGAAREALQQAATAVLVEATQRQQQAPHQQLQESMLVDFWTNPSRLAKQVEQQRRALRG